MLGPVEEPVPSSMVVGVVQLSSSPPLAVAVTWVGSGSTVLEADLVQLPSPVSKATVRVYTPGSLTVAMGVFWPAMMLGPSQK